MQLSKHVQRQVLKFQQTEITEYHIYKRLAKKVTPAENAQIIEQIAEDELRHYNGWKKYTNQDVEPRWFIVWFYYFISVVFGFTFGIKLMEQGEESVQESYASVSQDIPEAKQFQHGSGVGRRLYLCLLRPAIDSAFDARSYPSAGWGDCHIMGRACRGSLSQGWEENRSKA